MGGRGARRRGGGGGAGGGGAGGGKGAAGPTVEEVREAVAAAEASLPEPVREVLQDAGVRTRVVSEKQAVKEFGPRAHGSRGVYSHKSKTANVIQDRFLEPGGGGLRNAQMTALHELGHGYDLAKGSVRSRKFREALLEDRARLGRKRLTSKQREIVTYKHYKTESERIREVWAEGFAVVHGKGRPQADAKRPRWVDTALFRRAYPNTLKVIQELTST